MAHSVDIHRVAGLVIEEPRVDKGGDATRTIQVVCESGEKFSLQLYADDHRKLKPIRLRKGQHWLSIREGKAYTF